MSVHLLRPTFVRCPLGRGIIRPQCLPSRPPLLPRSSYAANIQNTHPPIAWLSTSSRRLQEHGKSKLTERMAQTFQGRLDRLDRMIDKECVAPSEGWTRHQRGTTFWCVLESIEKAVELDEYQAQSAREAGSQSLQEFNGRFQFSPHDREAMLKKIETIRQKLEQDGIPRPTNIEMTLWMFRRLLVRAVIPGTLLAYLLLQLGKGVLW
ncbi:hypothetical protein NA57DRAFT_71191 [Rhizodiscina lignyota]|uniref:Uncharacterized protein n=1 Tax=Rhizodiscina lignyota TaxID=1504668 RepID=A0A9P4MBU0_9PEZI|nr:hypothetical protein NA57DRAFT_71191 [Rhizodiscina lignyota]